MRPETVVLEMLQAVEAERGFKYGSYEETAGIAAALRWVLGGDEPEFEEATNQGGET